MPYSGKERRTHECLRNDYFEQMSGHIARTDERLKNLEKKADDSLDGIVKIHTRIDKLFAPDNKSKKIEYGITALIMAIIYAILEGLKKIM